jgi:complex I intermediate-associated protein 30 (CIA30)
VKGSPQRDIADIEKTARVFLAGREIDREALARDIATPDMSPLSAIPVAELADDFEGPADPLGPEYLRSRLGTLWVNSTDAGTDHSRMTFGTILRNPGDHALSVLGHMSVADRPFISVSLPLSRGGVEPADVSGYRGVRFDVRGDGEYRLVAPTRSERGRNYYQAAFQGAPEWKTVSIDFASMQRGASRQSAPWTGADLLSLVFRIERKPGETGWMELDNVRFYK